MQAKLQRRPETTGLFFWSKRKDRKSIERMMRLIWPVTRVNLVGKFWSRRERRSNLIGFDEGKKCLRRR